MGAHSWLFFRVYRLAVKLEVRLLRIPCDSKDNGFWFRLSITLVNVQQCCGDVASVASSANVSENVAWCSRCSILDQIGRQRNQSVSVDHWRSTWAIWFWLITDLYVWSTWFFSLETRWKLEMEAATSNRQIYAQIRTELFMLVSMNLICVSLISSALICPPGFHIRFLTVCEVVWLTVILEADIILQSR